MTDILSMKTPTRGGSLKGIHKGHTVLLCYPTTGGFTYATAKVTYNYGDRVTAGGHTFYKQNGVCLNNKNILLLPGSPENIKKWLDYKEQVARAEEEEEEFDAFMDVEDHEEDYFNSVDEDEDDEEEEEKPRPKKKPPQKPHVDEADDEDDEEEEEDDEDDEEEEEEELRKPRSPVDEMVTWLRRAQEWEIRKLIPEDELMHLHNLLVNQRAADTIKVTVTFELSFHDNVKRLSNRKEAPTPNMFANLVLDEFANLEDPDFFLATATSVQLPGQPPVDVNLVYAR